MKYLKQKLMAAVAMLVISTIMLTSASYAWFTISTAPEVQTVTTTITANQNFEIALGTDGNKAPEETKVDDSTKDYTWGATITSLTDQEFKGLGPAVVNGSALETVKYGSDGRPAAQVGVTRGTITNGIADIKDPEGNVIGWTILVWLRTNVDTANKKVTATVGDLTFGGDADSNNLIKVAFQQGTYDEGTKTVTDGSKFLVADNTNKTVEFENFPVNKPVPVKIHIYLDGETVTNENIASAVDAVIGNIEFNHNGIAEDSSLTYKNIDN